ncbi:hypothetical protein ACRALDRAFT_1061166 [Sodiomyces alcalophilus JCM 7366]|uniref:uncharacterized protein n=1 Tax=Sodiomyces alcalophilus JCM 7366 TaxID=591952 RepID=UPI0039B6B543
MASLARALRPVARRHLFGPVARRAFLSSKSSSGSGAGSSGPLDPQSEGELQVGEIEGAKFRIEPLRRVGEDAETTRARLLYQSRKRGTLESDLVLSTFADAYLPTMSVELMSQYDRFLDENDWDIYYWDIQVRSRPEGEWAQTVGTFKPAYRPVPSRWRDSEILRLIREHVRSRRADVDRGKGEGQKGEGMAFMPPL